MRQRLRCFRFVASCFFVLNGVALSVTVGAEDAKQSITVSSHGGLKYHEIDVSPVAVTVVRHVRREAAESVLSVGGQPSVEEDSAAVQSRAIAASTSCALVCGGILASISGCWLLFWALPTSGEARQALKLSLLCFSFGACSWAMNVLNKAIVGVLVAPALVTCAQMAMTAVATWIIARDQLVYDRSQLIQWSVVPFLFFGMLVSSFYTFEYLSLSMLVVIGNLAPLVTVPIEKVIMPADKQPLLDKWMILSLIVMLVGAISYGGAIHVSRIGMGFVLLNMVFSVANRLVQRLLLSTSCKDLTTETCMLANNVLGFIPTIILGCTVGEFQKFDSGLWFHSSATFLLILSGIVGSAISYFAIAVQKEITATSFMVLQNFARVAVVVVGIIVFHDPVESSRQLLGLLLNSCGAIMYGNAVLDAATKDKAAKIPTNKSFAEFNSNPSNPFAVRKVVYTPL